MDGKRQALLRQKYIEDGIGFVNMFDYGVTDAMKGYKKLTKDKFDYPQAYQAYSDGYDTTISHQEANNER